MTDTRKKIEEMIREYISQLYGSGLAELSSGEDPKPAKALEAKPGIIVIALENTCRDTAFAEYFRKLRESSKIGCLYDLEDSGTYEKAVSYIENMEQLDLYAPDIELLEHLVKMNSSSYKSIKLILKVLLQGKQVRIVMPHPVGTRNLVQKTYHKLLKEAESMGCVLYYLDAPEQREEKPVASSVLLETDVENALRNGNTEIIVSSGCIITPLAYDKLREADVSIRRIKQG